MLLIGSTAASLQISHFRKPNDVDLIVTQDEYEFILAIPSITQFTSSSSKRVLNYCGKLIEAEISASGDSSFDLLNESDLKIELEPFGVVNVASLDALFLLKKSHIWYKRKWRHHFNDYLILQHEVGDIPRRFQSIFDKRIEETKKRYKFKDHNFDIDNNKFFQSTVKRVVPHDAIHKMVAFGSRPMFEEIKDDLSKAAISYEKFQKLPYEKKLHNMQEECMVLTLERYIIPNHLAGSILKPKYWTRLIMEEMCYNYLPFDFRFFAVDNFFVILNGISNDFYLPILATIASAQMRDGLG